MNARREHYYTASPTAASKPEEIEYMLPGIWPGVSRDKPTGIPPVLPGTPPGIPSDIPPGAERKMLTFVTDSGVFSRRRVDFGSDLLIRSIPRLTGDVLDLGCGYGAIGVALAAMNPGARMWFADVNERALALCRENYARNVGGATGGGATGEGDKGGATGGGGEDAASGDAAARIIQSDGFSALGGAVFGVIVTNPPIRSGKANIFRLYRDARCHLAGGGYIYVVIQKKQGLDSTRAELADIYGNCDDIARQAGYHVLRAKRVPQRIP